MNESKSKLENDRAAEPVFTSDWFESVRPVWDLFIPALDAMRVLEVGSYEGASACYLISVLGAKAPLEMHCVDTWEGSAEFEGAGIDMREVEARFHRNTRLALDKSPFPVTLEIHKGCSDACLASLLVGKQKGYFDLVYIDSSHQACDVLSDAVLGFQLLRRHGIMVFDDYLWHDGPEGSKNPAQCPKMAIDAFVNCNFHKVRIVRAPLYQIYLQKLSD